jgi:hypothetical protein
MRRQGGFQRHDPTAADKLVRLMTRLANTPERFRDQLTPESLAATTGAPLKVCEYRLMIARQNWASQ